MKIKYLREVCHDELKDSIKENFQLYKNNKEWLDSYFKNSNYFIESSIEVSDVDLYLDKNMDYNNSILVYEAFKILNPYQASNIYLWSYLSHTYFYDYMHNRWEITSNTIDSESISKIKERYFCLSTRRGLFRNGISRLWWAAYLTYDENLDNPYEYTKILFSDEDLFIGLMERDYSMCSNVLKGILKYFKKYIEINSKLPPRESRRNFFKHLNFVGSTTLLEVLSIDEIYELTSKYFNEY